MCQSVPCPKKPPENKFAAPLAGCRVRILEGNFIGVTAFAPSKYLLGLKQTADG
jgi:hypothetical protein